MRISPQVNMFIWLYWYMAKKVLALLWVKGYKHRMAVYLLLVHNNTVSYVANKNVTRLAVSRCSQHDESEHAFALLLMVLRACKHP